MADPLFAVAHPIPETALALLREAGEVRLGAEPGPIPPAQLAELARDADALITLLYDRVDAALLDAIADRSRLRVVANVAVGYDNVDVAELNRRGILFTNTPGVLTDATADLAMALILSLTRRLGEGERLIRAGREWSWGLDFMLGTSLRGKTLGVVGLGQIGAATARRARAFGMEIAYTNRHRAAPELERELAARRLPLAELLATADILTLHCPLTAETHHLIDAHALARMKPTAYLINASRGPVVDEPALAAALARGEIAGAGLDVYEHEPRVNPDLLGMEDVVLAPHLGSATTETREAMAVLAARNAIEVCAARPPLTPVHP